MSSPEYNDTIRLISFALSDALEKVLECMGVPHSQTELLALIKRLTDNLMEAFDLGEREHLALKSAALRGMFDAHPGVYQ